MQREAGGTLHDQKAKFTLQAKEAEEETPKAFFDNSMNSKLALNCFFFFFFYFVCLDFSMQPQSGQ